MQLSHKYSILFKEESLKGTLPKVRNKAKMPSSSIIIIELKVSANVIREGKRITGKQTGKEEVKLS